MKKLIIILTAAMTLVFSAVYCMGAKPVLSETQGTKVTATVVPGDAPANDAVGNNGKVWEVELRDDPTAPEIKTEIVVRDLGSDSKVTNGNIFGIFDVSEYGVLLERPYGREIVVMSHDGKMTRKSILDYGKDTVFTGGAISGDGTMYFTRYHKDKSVEIYKIGRDMKLQEKKKYDEKSWSGVVLRESGLYLPSTEKVLVNGKKERQSFVKRLDEKGGKSKRGNMNEIYGIPDKVETKEPRAALLYMSGVYEETLTTEGDWQIVTAYSKSGRVVGKIRFNPKAFPKSNPDYVTSIDSIYMDRKGRIHAVVDTVLPPGPMRANAKIFGKATYVVMNTDGRVIAQGPGAPSAFTADGVGYVAVSNGELGKYWFDER